jgi:NhaP-type Na+/H+ or K+/H+ antiporter
MVNPSHLVLGVEAFVALIAAAILLSMLAERAGVPAAVLLVGAGMIGGSIWHIRPPFDFSQAILFIFLPPLIFEAAWNVHLAELRRTWKQIALLALPGTVVVASAIAGTITALGALPFGAALLFGAIVAATDPVAVIAVFRKFSVPDRVKTIVEAESLSNDGVAVVLYATALTIATGGSVNWLTSAGHGALEVAGGVAVGCSLAYAAWWLLRATSSAEYEVTTTVALASSPISPPIAWTFREFSPALQRVSCGARCSTEAFTRSRTWTTPIDSGIRPRISPTRSFSFRPGSSSNFRASFTSRRSSPLQSRSYSSLARCSSAWSCAMPVPV